MEVIFEPSGFLKYRGSYKLNNHSKSMLYKDPFELDEGKKDIIPIKLELQNLREKLT